MKRKWKEILGESLGAQAKLSFVKIEKKNRFVKAMKSLIGKRVLHRNHVDLQKLN